MMKSSLKCHLLYGGATGRGSGGCGYASVRGGMNYDYLPINNDGIRWRLVAVTTALLITAAAEK